MLLRSAWAQAVLACAALLGIACDGGGGEAGGGPRLRVELAAPDGALPSEYRAVLACGDRSEQRVERISCPGAPRSVPLACADGGLSIALASAPCALTVKARGFAFAALELDRSAAEQASVRLELARLPAFEANASYRTGFDPASAETEFLELAVLTDTELGPTHTLKFYVADLRGAPRVYFQNTRRHPLHYDFAREVLGAAQSRAEFELRTYRGPERSALAGSLLYRPELAFDSAAAEGELTAPITLEFFPSDDLSPELALRAHQLLEERLGLVAFAGLARRLVYVPAGSVQEAALAGAGAGFAARDALWSSSVEAHAGIEQQLLNPGLAYGTLRRFDPEQLARAVLSYRDIALLTRLPNDLPLLGGTLTEELQTPLAHVNLAARARGTPNAALRFASEDPRVAPFLDQLVRYEVTPQGFSIAAAELEEAEAYWQARAPAPLVPESDLAFAGLPGFEELGFGDAVRVGAKAANLAELRGLLGDAAPAGFAVPFSAYDRYMRERRVTSALCAEARDNCAREGRAAALCDAALALCEASAQAGDDYFGHLDRLLAAEALAADGAQREASVDGLRYLVAHGEVDAEFADALDARVAELFGDGQVRLRSSTNAEDLPGFSGAGLYESVSARASGDTRASQRIREVWASVFLFRAFEERQFWNVDQRAIRMAVAVNPAVDGEAVNGVLITRNLLQPGASGLYVNAQAGETEVTNPRSGALPEVFTIVAAPGGGVQVVRDRFSSLSPDAPLLSDAEVAALADAAQRSAAHFAALYGVAPSRFALDLEWKLVGEARALLVKQARPYASSSSR